MSEAFAAVRPRCDGLLQRFAPRKPQSQRKAVSILHALVRPTPVTG